MGAEQLERVQGSYVYRALYPRISPYADPALDRRRRHRHLHRAGRPPAPRPAAALRGGLDPDALCPRCGFRSREATPR